MAAQWNSAAVLPPQQNQGSAMPMPPPGQAVSNQQMLQQQQLPAPPGMPPGAGGTPGANAQIGTPGTMPPGTPGMPPPPQNNPNQTAMNPGQPGNSQFGNNPMGVMPPDNGLDRGAGSEFNPTEKNYYGGQKIAGADPSQADYGSVQGYADQAYDQARTRIDPMQEQAGRRMEQDLINKGIDPSSEQGKAMLTQQNQNFSDQDNAATFGALQFGQGIQNQMAGQEQQKAALGGDMQKALWQNQLGGKGLEVQEGLGYANADNARYGMDQGFQLGMGNLDLNQNQAEHGQTMDYLGYDMNVNQFNQNQQMMQDALYNQQYSGVPVPGMNQTNPYAPADTMLSAGDTTWWKQGLKAKASGGMGF